MTQAVALLVNSAPQFNIALISRGEGTAIFDVPVPTPGGRRRVFQLRVIGDDQRATAREIGGMLPSFCPPRHINQDASFCLGWGDDAAPEVVNEHSAELWWGLVLAFLRLQIRASYARRWMGQEWAHGAAAIYQLGAENAAKSLGADVLDDMRRGQISVRWSNRRAPAGGRILKVLRRGQEWFSVWEDARRVVNKQQACVCAAGSVRHHRRLRNCRDHAIQAYKLGMSLWLWSEAEARFWDFFRGIACCGTMDGCPLRNGGHPAGQENKNGAN